MLATLGLAYLAGVLSTLSPCVLPLLPAVVSSAASEHRLGPVALALGLACSFILVGLFLAILGFEIGLDTDLFRILAAVLMILVGAALIAPSLQTRLVLAAGPVSNAGDKWLARISTFGLRGQFCVGLLLGVVWTPCVGPTLGAATVLAAQGKDVPQVALTMLVFGFGASSPLLAVGILSRALLVRARNRLMSVTHQVKAVLGIGFVLVGASIVTGVDKHIEAMLVDASPQWLTDLTTRF
jgi:cytochrome c biogenesis protein CcdA